MARTRMAFAALTTLPLTFSMALSGAVAQDGTESAQQSVPTTASAASSVLLEVEDESYMIEAFNITVGELNSMMLFDSEGDQFGEIETILGDGAGNVTAVSVEIGGFLGVGDREIILPISEITPNGLRLMVNMTGAEVQELPFWG